MSVFLRSSSQQIPVKLNYDMFLLQPNLDYPTLCNENGVKNMQRLNLLCSIPPDIHNIFK